MTDENVGRGEQSFALYIVLKYVGFILTEACVDLFIVELDEAALDVLGAFKGDFSLEGHAVEGKVINGEVEFIRKDIIAQRDLPLYFVNLDFEREHAGVLELFSSHEFFGLLVLQLHKPALLEECAQDDVAHVHEDDMECDLPLFGSIDVSDLVTMNPFIQLGCGQLLSVHTVVHQGQLVHLQVEANAQLPAKVGDVLDRLFSKLQPFDSDRLLLFKAIDPDTNKVVRCVN